MSADFGFEPDAEGFVQFMTIQLQTEVHCFAEYMEVFDAMVELAMQNAGVMPIITFPDAPQGWNGEESS